ncbi:5'-methylthioadenosine phosphorylase [Patulibacter medicamentivorans]|jgi:purine nucleoside phosphorylase|uniref:5'-methylthioadenosine phosphorylase n=1 Tax=Patulibacter medicamentivorans TaxID=1097667 RepID=H0E1M2_9ACTN|nr:MTAP family purine nucleoside phosphorylase [Patulibacter medicamentivorans]EHN12417.1 5'-methylthioadenosine phosphorylase [Patulibacter medicamentivorans]
MRIAVVTGSGTYALPGLADASRTTVETAHGAVPVTLGAVDGSEIVHLARHRDGHELVSHQVTHRANVAALQQLQVDAVLAVTVCGACDPSATLGSLLVFDDLHFLSNRLPDGSLCTLHDTPAAPGRGHWVFEGPFSEPLRRALLAAAADADLAAADGGVYGHVDGPRFNTRAEIRSLVAAGVSAVSQTAGPETVLCGEAGIPYALLGFQTDYANGVGDEATPVSTLLELIARSTASFSAVLAGAIPRVAADPPAAVGTSLTWD